MTVVVWPHRTSPLRQRAAGMQNVPIVQASTRIRARVTTKTIRIIMAGGGTGGHLYPGLAVADALRSQLGDALELVWAATPRQVDQRLLGKFGKHYIAQPVQPLVKDVTKIWGFWKGWRRSCAFWTAEFQLRKPACVVALGGYAAGPAAYVAGKFGVPVVLLNPDAVPGLANRFLLKRAQRVFVQWELPAQYASKIRGGVLALGCPIRPALVRRSREEGLAALGLDGGKSTLVITGASLGAKTINDALLLLLRDAEIRPAFLRAGGSWQILHLSGTQQAEEVRLAYAAMPEINAKVMDYCDDMASVWAAADLAIARAGASTCAELTACGVPSLLLPYPFHKDMHQKINALRLVEAGAAVIVDDEKDATVNAAAIKKMLGGLLYDATLRQRMRQAARSAGKPDAATHIAEEIARLVGGPI